MRKDSPWFEFKEQFSLYRYSAQRFYTKWKKKSVKYYEKVVIVERLDVKTSLTVATGRREDNSGQEINNRLYFMSFIRL